MILSQEWGYPFPWTGRGTPPPPPPTGQDRYSSRTGATQPPVRGQRGTNTDEVPATSIPTTRCTPSFLINRKFCIFPSVSCKTKIKIPCFSVTGHLKEYSFNYIWGRHTVRTWSRTFLYSLQVLKQDHKKKLQYFLKRQGISMLDNGQLLIFQGLKKEHETNMSNIFLPPEICPYIAILEDKNTQC